MPARGDSQCRLSRHRVKTQCAPWPLRSRETGGAAGLGGEALGVDGNLRAALRAARVALDLQSHVPVATQLDILSPSPEVARVEHRRQQFDMASPRELAEYRYWRLRSLRIGGLG